MIVVRFHAEQMEACAKSVSPLKLWVRRRQDQTAGVPQQGTHLLHIGFRLDMLYERERHDGVEAYRGWQ